MKSNASGKKTYDRSLMACPKWNRANSSEKVKMIEEVQAIPMDICKICSNIGHKSTRCFNRASYVCENSNCGQVHIKEMCTFQPYITGCLQHISEPLPWGGGMSLQDVRVDELNTNSTGRTLFDGGSQLTLVNNTFAREQKFGKINASYSLQGIGGTVNHYQSGKDGYLWLVPLLRNTGKIDWVNAYGVNKILEPVERG